MKSANRLTLVGVLGKSPELRESKAGTKYCYVAIATTESYKPKDSEEWKDETTWHDVAYFGKDAERICEWANKGDSIYVEAKLKYRKKEIGEETVYTPSVVGSGFKLFAKAPKKEAAVESKQLAAEGDLPF
jgi:single-strand DNA-binding protein